MVQQLPNSSGGKSEWSTLPGIQGKYIRCFVRLFKLYKNLCPLEPKRNAFYLKPLKKTSWDRWFSADLVGHNVLSKTVSRLCIEAGITGFKTNHSLRDSAATQLFEEGLDKQLIMEWAGHKSIDGVCTYKRTLEKQCQEVSDILNKSKKLAQTPLEILSQWLFNLYSHKNYLIQHQYSQQHNSHMRTVFNIPPLWLICLVHLTSIPAGQLLSTLTQRAVTRIGYIPS